MLLLELISTLDWEWDGSYEEGEISASFTIPSEDGDKTYSVIFINEPEDEEHVWDVEFTLVGSATPIGLTGTGHARTVFAAVIQIVKEFIESEAPAGLVFSASEPQRFKLYSRLLRMLQDAYGAHIHEEPDDVVGGRKYIARL